MTTATANKVKAPKKGFKLDRQMIPTLAAVVIFILMIIMGQALFGTYIRLGFISSLFIDHAYLIILAVAMTLPILTGGIDLSVGAIVAITAVVGLKLANAGVPAFLVMIIMLLIGAVFGLLAGTLIEEFNMQPFIATLSTMFLARGLASIISTDSLTFPQGNDFSFISNVIKIIDNPKISNDLSFNVGVIIALVVVVFGYVFLHHTRTGRTIYAIGGSRSSAELMGLPVKRTQYIIYLTSATLAPWPRSCTPQTSALPRTPWVLAGSSTPLPPWSSAVRSSPVASATCSAPCSALWSAPSSIRSPLTSVCRPNGPPSLSVS